MPAKPNKDSIGAAARLLTTALMLDTKYTSDMADLPYGMLLDLMTNLGLLPLQECEGATPAEELYDYASRVTRCQKAIKKLRAQ